MNLRVLSRCRPRIQCRFYSKPSNPGANKSIDMFEFQPPELIRNFSIIAHIDHGKSTLADRLLELTNTIPLSISSTGKSSNAQVLDKLKVERERGITVKAQTASMIYTSQKNLSQRLLLNLIDTPGHVDFSWEVRRSLAACQGALLLVDSTQGIQAQTISVFHIAQEMGLTIIPVLNKLDLPASDPAAIAQQLQTTFGLQPPFLKISAKTGQGVDQVLEAIVDRIPPPSPPKEVQDGRLKAFLFDSLYDRYRGVISLVNVQSGVLKKGTRIQSHHTGKKYEVAEVGILHPDEVPVAALCEGQVGWMACNMKEVSEAHVGDTLFKVGALVEPMPGFKPAKAMVFAGIYPIDNADFPKLEESIKRLTLTDRSVTVQREGSTALGQGCRLGFLGTLHMDVFRQRLEDEYDANIIITAPTVPYKIIHQQRPSDPVREEFISNPTDFPDFSDIKTSAGVKEIQEPIVKASIIIPEDYLGEMMDLVYQHRAENLTHKYLSTSSSESSEATDGSRIMLNCTIPLSEIVTDFFDELKSKSSGFASFDYEDAGYMKSDMKKMTFLLNNKVVDALALIVHSSHAENVARDWVKKLHKVIPRQQFEVPIQAIIGKKVIARETLKAYRADVTAGLYGGHYERKLKHLVNQKEAKKRMKRLGSVDLPQEAFFDIMKTNK